MQPSLGLEACKIARALFEGLSSERASLPRVLLRQRVSVGTLFSACACTQSTLCIVALHPPPLPPDAAASCEPTCPHVETEIPTVARLATFARHLVALATGPETPVTSIDHA